MNNNGVYYCTGCSMLHTLGYVCTSQSDAKLLEATSRGWRCPVCGSGCAPTLERCPCVQPKLTTAGYSVTP